MSGVDWSDDDGQPETPFLALGDGVSAHPVRGAPLTPRGAAGSSVPGLYAGACTGVRTIFPHLDTADIAAPPYRWADAALARQIALHLLVTRFDVPKRRLVEELARTRSSIDRALEVVDERLVGPEFEGAYRAAEAATERALNKADGDDA